MEMSVPIVMVKTAGFTGINRRPAIDFCRGAAENICLRRPFHIVADEQIDLAVPVISHPCGGSGPTRVLDAALLRHVREPASAVPIRNVMEEAAAPYGCNEQVFITVVIEVSDSHSHSLHRQVKSNL